MDFDPLANLSDRPTPLTAATLASLEDCSELSVYAPGYIQSHGLLLHLQPPNLTIVQVSANVTELLRMTPDALLGQPLSCVFPHRQLKPLLAQIADSRQVSQPLTFKRTIRLNSATNQAAKDIQQVFWGQAHQTADGLLLELEPVHPRSPLPTTSLFYPTFRTLNWHKNN